ncbi:AEC family transporter [Alkalibacter rhizosphaerae]|uniref:AEC family transporter n=1 Tax=Alkalibacter rhizosphaerae TaxID=2815577 RepID=A0A974XGD1_9FIRM|nr:AEC family transporter [Alkalibacter rhizosphaerae]QSX09372.1 AEC family transporter [Alkalibacter rhizosphaerae]
MFQNLVFSLGVALPIFLVILTGYILRRVDFIDQEFVKKANRLVFYIALPLKLFNDVRNMDIEKIVDLRFFTFVAAAIVCSVGVAWLISYLVGIHPDQRGTFIQGSFRGNFLYVGFSLIENILGSLGAKPPMVLALTIPLYNILSLVIFAFNKPEGTGKISIGSSMKDLASNPMIIGISFGILAVWLNPPIPDFTLKTIDYVQSMATPLALLSIGASFDLQKVGRKIRATAWAVACKLVIFPTLAVAAGFMMGFDGADLLNIYVLFGVPTSTVSFIFAMTMDGDGELASSIIMTTTLFSVFSTTLFIFGLKTLGIL